MLPVTYEDVQAAVPRVRRYLQPTLLHDWPGLCEGLGFRFYLKHENHQPVGAFKVRGGINLVSQLPESQREAGILGVSTGNHGQSLAFAARQFGLPCTIIVPLGNNPDKNRAIRGLGAELIEQGRDFDEAREFAETIVQQRGCRYVHSANEPQLIAGVGTMAVEIFDRLPRPDVILVPIGLGSGVCGTGIVARALHPECRIIGVQARGAPAMAESWRRGQPVSTPRADTWAEGLATRVPAEMTLLIMREVMDDVILVDDAQLLAAVGRIARDTHNLAEGAGAATFAAAQIGRERFRGQTVVGILSGGNLDLTMLPAALESSAS